jgi:Zn-finger nucleic acid-binding protein
MALLETRPCWQCGHCATLVCPEEMAAEGVRVLSDGEHDCPVCRRPMLRGVIDDRERIETCPQCQGILMARRAFAVTLTARRRRSSGPTVTPLHTDAAELARRIACPLCGSRMTTDWYYGPGNIVIDTCPTCDVVWLDGGEFQRVVEAPGTDRHA